MSSIPPARKLSDLLGQLSYVAWMQAWRKTAGPVLLKQTNFMGIHRQKSGLALRIDVPDPMWRQELTYQKEELLKRFRKALDDLGVPASGQPTDILLGAASVPFKSGNAKKNWNKKGV